MKHVWPSQSRECLHARNFLSLFPIFLSYYESEKGAEPKNLHKKYGEGDNGRVEMEPFWTTEESIYREKEKRRPDWLIQNSLLLANLSSHAFARGSSCNASSVLHDRPAIQRAHCSMEPFTLDIFIAVRVSTEKSLRLLRLYVAPLSRAVRCQSQCSHTPRHNICICLKRILRKHQLCLLKSHLFLFWKITQNRKYSFETQK